MKLNTRIARLERERPAPPPAQGPSPELEPDLLARIQALKAAGRFPAGLSDADFEVLMRAKRGEIER